MTQQTVIEPVDRAKLQAELTADKFSRKTNYGNREIYITNAHESPFLMRELGRLREISFREQGGGTGKTLDIDTYDTDTEAPFKQLIVWSPEDQEIVGGYRFLEGHLMGMDEQGMPKSPTSKLFHFSPLFVKKYLPHSIELGRSFIQPKYQLARGGLYSLDNLWDGLGAVTMNTPSLQYYFGKVTMYPRFNKEARDYVLHFVHKYFPDNEQLLQPILPLQPEIAQEELEALFVGKNYRENYKILFRKIQQYKENIPPLINAYMNLSPTMKTFGTAINTAFGGVEETGMLITVADIYEAKIQRHLTPKSE